MIPRVIHHVWVGGPLPAHLEDYVRSWAALHPEWEHRVWGDDDLTWLANQPTFDAAEDITPWHGQLRSDIARYEILARHGGVYVDCDMEALRPIDELLDVDCFAGWETDGEWVNNAIMGAVPHHPLLDDLIGGLEANVARHRGQRPNVMTGPQYMTPAALAHEVEIHPSSAFYPYRWDNLDAMGGDYGDAFAVHHWNRKRTLAGAWP